MLAPVVRALAEQHPETQITMLSQQRMADLFTDMPSNVSFRGVDLHGLSLHEIVTGLGHYDLVADMHGVWRSLYIRWRMRLKGARVAHICKGRWSKRQLTTGKIHRPLKHTTARYQDVLTALGLPVELQVNPTIVSKISAKGVGVAPFAAHKGKIYPIDRMERVVEMLSERGEHVVLFGGGKQEQAILDSWAAKYKGVESVAGKRSLAEEIALMRSLRVMLTMDSANMHLASLAGTRVVSVWGATHPYAGFLGYGQSENDCIQRELPCRPCSIYGNQPCRLGDYRCMDITPEAIIDKLCDPS